MPLSTMAWYVSTSPASELGPSKTVTFALGAIACRTSMSSSTSTWPSPSAPEPPSTFDTVGVGEPRL